VGHFNQFGTAHSLIAKGQGGVRFFVTTRTSLDVVYDFMYRRNTEVASPAHVEHSDVRVLAGLLRCAQRELMGTTRGHPDSYREGLRGGMAGCASDIRLLDFQCGDQRKRSGRVEL
jgi:hypothetical protein